MSPQSAYTLTNKLFRIVVFCSVLALPFLASCGRQETQSSVSSPSPAPEATTTTPPGLVFRADPNPVPAGSGPGRTIISWDTGSNAQADVVLVTGDKETTFGRGAKISQEATWIQPGSWEFRMYSTTDHKLLAKLTVTRPLAPASPSPSP